MLYMTRTALWSNILDVRITDDLKSQDIHFSITHFILTIIITLYGIQRFELVTISFYSGKKSGIKFYDGYSEIWRQYSGPYTIGHFSNSKMKNLSRFLPAWFPLLVQKCEEDIQLYGCVTRIFDYRKTTESVFLLTKTFTCRVFKSWD